MPNLDFHIAILDITDEQLDELTMVVELNTAVDFFCYDVITDAKGQRCVWGLLCLANRHTCSQVKSYFPIGMKLWARVENNPLNQLYKFQRIANYPTLKSYGDSLYMEKRKPGIPADLQRFVVDCHRKKTYEELTEAYPRMMLPKPTKFCQKYLDKYKVRKEPPKTTATEEQPSKKQKTRL